MTKHASPIRSIPPYPTRAIAMLCALILLTFSYLVYEAGERKENSIDQTRRELLHTARKIAHYIDVVITFDPQISGMGNSIGSKLVIQSKDAVTFLPRGVTAYIVDTTSATTTIHPITQVGLLAPSIKQLPVDILTTIQNSPQEAHSFPVVLHDSSEGSVFGTMACMPTAEPMPGIQACVAQSNQTTIEQWKEELAVLCLLTLLVLAGSLSTLLYSRRFIVKKVTACMQQLHNTQRMYTRAASTADRYKSIFDLTHEPIAIFRNQHVLLANAAHEKLFHHHDEKSNKLNLLQHVHPDDVLRVVLDETRVEQEDSPQQYVFRLITAQNNTQWIQAMRTIIPWDDGKASLIHYRDISSLKNDLEYLKNKESMFEGLWENMPFACAFLNLNGSFLSANPAWSEVQHRLCQKLNYSEEAVAPEYYNLAKDPIIASYHLEKEVQAALTGESFSTGSITIIDATENTTWSYSLSVFPLLTKRGEIKHLVSIHQESHIPPTS